MCSKLTPRARIPDTRIPQLMQPWRELSFTIGISCKYIAWGINAWARFANSRGILLHPMPPSSPHLALHECLHHHHHHHLCHHLHRHTHHHWTLHECLQYFVFSPPNTKAHNIQSVSKSVDLQNCLTFYIWKAFLKPNFKKKELELQINAEAVYAVRPWICNCAFRADFDRCNILRHGGESTYYVHLLLPV